MVELELWPLASARVFLCCHPLISAATKTTMTMMASANWSAVTACAGISDYGRPPARSLSALRMAEPYGELTGSQKISSDGLD